MVNDCVGACRLLQCQAIVMLSTRKCSFANPELFFKLFDELPNDSEFDRYVKELEAMDTGPVKRRQLSIVTATEVTHHTQASDMMTKLHEQQTSS